jgi:hypothetical protein
MNYRFITICTRAISWSQYWAISIQPIPPDSIFLKSLLILLNHLCLVFPSCLIPYSFPTSDLYAFHFSPFMLHALLTSSLWLDHSNYTWRSVHVMQFILYSFFQPSVSTPAPGPTALSTLFWNTVCPNVLMSDQVSHPYRTTGKIIVFCNIILACLDSRHEDKR